MAISNTPRPAYIYKDGTWYPISSPVNTAANYDWSGDHDFASSVTFEEVLQAKAGVNNFQNLTARDAAFSSPIAPGTVVFVRQDNSGNTLNQIQYYFGGDWINYQDISIDEKTTSYTIALKDVNRMIKLNSSSNLELLIPAEASADFPVGSRLEILRAGTGEVTVASVLGAGVTIRSKNNNTKISTQFSGAMLTKIGTDEWHLIGDLKA